MVVSEQGTRVGEVATPPSAADRADSPIVRKVMPELDTLRGIAVLMVVVFHGFAYLLGFYAPASFSLPAKALISVSWFGWMGVNLFFVLSGFLITGILLDSRSKPRYFSTFYIRRSLRILPIYYLLLLALPLVASIPHFPREVGWSFVALAGVYLANMVEFFGVGMQYGPLWSLAVEEHFYLLWPSVVKTATPRKLLGIAIAIILISPALRVWTPGVPGVTWKNLDGLAMGACAALIVRNATRNQVVRLAAFSFGFGSLALALAFLFRVHLSTDRLGVAFAITFTDLMFLGVLVSFLLIGTSAKKRWVNIGWLKFYGFISYGLYLIHMLVFDGYDAWRGHPVLAPGPLVIRFLFVLAASTALAYISRVTLEEWFLGFKSVTHNATRNP